MGDVRYGSRTCVVETRLFAEKTYGGVDVYPSGMANCQAEISDDGMQLTITNISYSVISRVIGIN